MTKTQIEAYIEAHREEIIADIIQLIRFRSTNGQKSETQACLEFFLNRAREFGFRTMSTSSGDVGIVEMGQGDETIGILVHLDVVEIGDIDKWTNDPFDCVQRDGFLWGRGAQDDKGAAIMSLYAMKAVKELNLPMHRKVWLIAGTSEEVVWTDIASFKCEFPQPDFGFSPDGQFPIYNIEMGYADLQLNFMRDGNRGIRMLQSGENPNTIPSKAMIELKDGRSIISHGISSHSSMPEEGDNAIIKLCADLKSEAGVDFDFVNFVNRFCHNDGSQLDLRIDNGIDTLDGEFIGLTTVSPTMLQLEEESVRLTVNIRHKYGTSREQVMDAFLKHAGEFGFTLSTFDYLEPMRVSSKLPFLTVMREVSEEFGLEGKFCLARGTSYAKSMDNFVSWGPVFPGDPETAHIEDERISVSTVLLATKLYARFIERMVGDD